MVPVSQMKLGRLRDLPKIPRASDYGRGHTRAHIILLHRCSVDRKWRGMRGLAGYFPDLGLHTTLTAESAGASEALMITCAWYWAAFLKIEK